MAIRTRLRSPPRHAGPASSRGRTPTTASSARKVSLASKAGVVSSPAASCTVGAGAGRQNLRLGRAPARQGPGRLCAGRDVAQIHRLERLDRGCHPNFDALESRPERLLKAVGPVHVQTRVRPKQDQRLAAVCVDHDRISGEGHSFRDPAPQRRRRIGRGGLAGLDGAGRRSRIRHHDLIQGSVHRHMQRSREPFTQAQLGVGDQTSRADQGRDGHLALVRARIQERHAGICAGKDILDRKAGLRRGAAFEADGAQGQGQGCGHQDEHQDHRKPSPWGGTFQQSWPKPVESRCQRRRKGDRHEVGHEQKDGAAGDPEIAGPQPETDSGDGRHQGCRDGHADDGLSPLTDHRIGAGDAGKDGDEQVEEVRARARQDFAGRFLQGRQQGQEHGDRERQTYADRQGQHRTLQLLPVEQGQREAESHDRPHHRRYQHGADDDGGRVEHQPESRDGGRDNRHREVSPGQPAILIDGVGDVRVIDAPTGRRQGATRNAAGFSSGGRG